MGMQPKAYKWSREKAGVLLKLDFVRFGMVGAVGFVVTFIFKGLFHKVFNLTILPSTFLGSEAGVMSNFIFHQTWTYKRVDHSHKSIQKKFFHFQLSSLSGVIIFTLLVVAVARLTHHDGILGLVIAAGITMFWNFFWTKYFIFKGHTPKVLLSPEDATADVEE